MWRQAIGAAAALLLVACATLPGAMKLRVTDVADGCVTEVGKRKLRSGDGASGEVMAALKGWRNDRALVRTDANITDICIGGTLYALQENGFRTIDFVVEGLPPRKQLRAAERPDR